ncbi:uncharacterized protein LOC105695766 [Orussus abietinus]|uniref:uncharacterized protein LOC105695766 n=1 Tax=Orussus abietinus TaxID=222816 RepID=UPI000625869A|nr:uncharacterized protein LOC105695766 [Orussus abietinus]
MDLKLFTVIILAVLSGTSGSAVLSLVHDLVQNNVAGSPVIHEKTQWNFDPDLGKQRRVLYERLNGRMGEDEIERLGSGIGYKGPWGTPVQ